MKISATARGRDALVSVCVVAVVVFLCGCPASEGKKPKPSRPVEQQPEKKPVVEKKEPEPRPELKAEPKAVKPVDAGRETTPAKKAEPDDGLEENLSGELIETEKKPRDLGPPLVDNPEELAPLSREQPVWMDQKNKYIVLLGEVCEAGYPLEFFATYTNRAYEAVLAVNVTPSIVHTGLLAIGAKPGHPARFEPRFVPPTGTEIAIEVRWKDQDGKVQSAPAQHWIRNIKTKKELDSNWVFAGSGFYTDETTGKKYYQADSGELICVLSLPNAMLDLPIRSYGAIEERIFEAFKEHLPPAGTPTTILLKPVLGKAAAEKTAGETSAKKAVPAVDEKIDEAKRKALEAAQQWLDLVDRDQYTRGWETAAKQLNISTPRREFIKTLNETRKPLGKVKSRKLVANKYTRSIPSGADGQYIILEYVSSFEKKPTVAEVVTLTLNGDSKWRVLGYHFK